MWYMNVYKKARYDKIWSFPFKFVTHEMLSKAHKMPKNSWTWKHLCHPHYHYTNQREGGLAIEEYSTWVEWMILNGEFINPIRNPFPSVKKIN